MWKVAILSLVLLLAATTAFGQQAGCLLASQRPMIVAELFFGRAIRGRGQVSEAEWSGFVASVVAKQLPDGFTVQDGAGHWLDPVTQKVVGERTKILIVAGDPATDLGTRLRAVMAGYRRRFRQKSVGIITTSGCGAF